MEREKTRLYRRPWARALAGVLVLLLFLSLLSGLWIRVRISADTEDAAQGYLAGETEYVNASELERLIEQLRNLRQPTKLENYYSRAGTRIAMEDYAQALTYIEKCLELYTPDYGEPLHVDLLIKQGCLLTLLDRSEEAIAPLNAALELDPSQSAVYLVLAQIYSGTGQTSELMDALSAYLELEPEESELRLMLAQLRYAMEEYPAAADQTAYLLESGAQQGPELAALCLNLGIQLTQAQEYDRALVQLDGAIALQAFLQTEEPSEPEDGEEADDAQALEEQLASLHYYRGLCNLTLKHYEEAVEDYDKAIEQGVLPQLSHYSRGVAECMSEEPDYQQAVEDLVFAVNYQGEDDDTAIAAQALELLEILTTEN